MTLAENNQLVEQVQIAHRICVAFYRRILPNFDEIAREFDCEFVEWSPLHTSRPCRGTSQPSKPWAWDFVPLFASSHIYWKTEGKVCQPNDLAIQFKLYVDDNMKPENRKKLELKEGRQPGAISMEKGAPLLEVFLYRPLGETTSSFAKCWEKAKEPELGGEQMSDVGGGLQAVAFAMPLSEIVEDYHLVIEKIKPFLL